MKHDFLTHAFTAASHIPHMTDFLHGLRFHFHSNSFDITEKTQIKRHFIGLTVKARF